ncbi:reverse transcriptase domain-containing protein [Telmatobacter bradus]|uniref:reverse transcriptase domain-containing protein n=1 Tax=Telmatobacter bradus TaxID=474953 RepID=UPI003B428D51
MRKLITLSELRIAWAKLNKRNPRSFGVDGISIAAFAANSESQIRKIAQQLADGSYQFQGSKGVLIDKSDGGKRPLKIATVRDRVVAKALALYLEPKLQRFDQLCSFGYRKKMGTRDAVEAIHKLADSGSKWVLEADIKKFFDKVDRKILLQKLARVVRSPQKLALIDKALTSEIENRHVIDPDLLQLFPSAASGIPQGNALSPLLANYYLHTFDRAMLKKGYGLVRYADDFVVMCKTRQDAEQACIYAQALLKNKLSLEMHELSFSGKTQIRRYSDGFQFVGFFIRDRKQMPPEKSKTKYKERIKEILRSNQGETLLRKIQRLNNISKGWHEAFKTTVLDDFPKLADAFLLSELSQFLNEKKIFRKGDTMSFQQAHFLGVITLGDRVRDGNKGDEKQNASRKGRGPRIRIVNQAHPSSALSTIT